MIRVRPLLCILNAVERQELKKLLPPKLKMPEEPDGVRYPAALIAALGVAAPGQQYGLTGFITEDLLAFPPAEITPDHLLTVVRARCPSLSAELAAKIVKSKTTEPFLNHIRATRTQMYAVARGDIRHEETIGNATVEGHPDYRTDTQIFEVKMTGRLKQNWSDFLFQVFAYAALAPETTDIYLVFPLQEILWHHDVRGWTKREAFRTYLETAATKKSETTGPAHDLIAAYNIGSHCQKLKSLVDTVHSLPLDRPSQIFLCGPQSSRLNIVDAELTASASALGSKALYIHSPYIINLCTATSTENEAYHTALLIKHLEYGVKIGARGVVVHVGKSTTQPPAQALATMKTNLLNAIQVATPACPILLETPAGQGTEVLRTWDEFSAFVADINDPRLRICIDTCHVFACGAQPHDYLTRTIAAHPGLTGLIHFNDSAAPCGSCLDRHALVGEGNIGLTTMTAIASTATSAGIPMVIE